MCLRSRLLLMIPVILIVCNCSPDKPAPDPALSYDLMFRQEPVLSHSAVDSILAKLELVPFQKLDKDYLKYSESDGPFKAQLQNKTYYKVYGKAIFKYVAGKIRIKDLLPQDSFYIRNLENLDSNYYQYWLIDKKLLYKTVDLIAELKKGGYDEYAYEAKHGHRHPQLNYKVGGALGSRHLFGEAIDLRIGDINKDGEANQVDKAIVMEILEKKIIKDKGGIGRYPETMIIHYDTRGYKRRWNSYTPAKKLKK